MQDEQIKSELPELIELLTLLKIGNDKRLAAKLYSSFQIGEIDSLITEEGIEEDKKTSITDLFKKLLDDQKKRLALHYLEITYKAKHGTYKTCFVSDDHAYLIPRNVSASGQSHSNREAIKTLINHEVIDDLNNPILNK